MNLRLKESSRSLTRYVLGMAKERLIAALTLLDQYDRVILIGADCEIKSRMYELHAEFAKNDVVIVPHAISPVASRDYMAQIYRTGHANADLIAFKNTENSRNILKWLISVTEGDELKTKGIFYEQTWLSSIPFLFDNVSILRHPGYNVGYWDIEERELKRHNRQNKVMYYVLDNEPVRMVQYSGYVKGSPERMSKYAGKTATGDILKLYQEYDERITE